MTNLRQQFGLICTVCAMDCYRSYSERITTSVLLAASLSISLLKLDLSG